MPSRPAEIALDNVRRRADHTDALKAVGAQLGCSRGEAAALSRRVASRPIAVHLHPDRIDRSGRLTVDGLLTDGVLRNAFATGTSAGSAEAARDGRRSQWEDHLFGAAYPAAAATARPIYGALDVHGYPDGPAASFGSCFVVLAAHVNGRSTFCFGDSHTLPDHVGTVDTFGSVLHALQGSGPVPEPLLTAPGHFPAAADPGRVYDRYVEVQVHDPVELERDADALVCDPSFRTAPVGSLLAELADRFDLELCWHGGFALELSDFPDTFVTPAGPEPLDELRAFAADVACACDTDVLTAAVVGQAARSMVLTPNLWETWGPPGVTLQLVKPLWKVIVRAGVWPSV